jgi:ABC-type Fe3+ transport system permease subunit
MASTCPNCGKKLHIYNVKAECSSCGVSIPNFNWEERLEEDNARAEQKFQSFYRTLNRFAYSVWGTKLRIVRIILSFIPALGFILPWATLNSDAQSVGLDLLGMTSSNSLIDVISGFFGNVNLYFTNMAYEGYSGALTYIMVSVMFMLLSALLIVIAFFLIIFLAKKPKTKAIVVFDILSIISAIVSAIMFTLGVNVASSEIGFNFGAFPIYNANGGITWGFYVAIALLVVATVANILVARAPAKSDETLEEERLARKAVKEEKERQDAIAKEKAREEAEKQAAIEQAEKIAQAKAKLAEREAKKKK